MNRRAPSLYVYRCDILRVTVETPENETDAAIEETTENIDEYLEELISNALDTSFEKYEKWKRKTPTFIKDTTNRLHNIQNSKSVILMKKNGLTYSLRLVRTQLRKTHISD